MMPGNYLTECCGMLLYLKRDCYDLLSGSCLCESTNWGWFDPHYVVRGDFHCLTLVSEDFVKASYTHNAGMYGYPPNMVMVIP